MALETTIPLIWTVGQVNINFSGWIHAVSQMPLQEEIAEFAYPDAIGRVYQLMGGGHSDMSSRGVIFAEEGTHRNRICGASKVAIENLIEAISAARILGTVGTLTYRPDGVTTTWSLPYMKLGEFRRIGIPTWHKHSGSTFWKQQFYARFTQYLV